MSKIAIVGAGGFVGTSLIESLVLFAFVVAFLLQGKIAF